MVSLLAMSGLRYLLDVHVGELLQAAGYVNREFRDKAAVINVAVVSE